MTRKSKSMKRRSSTTNLAYSRSNSDNGCFAAVDVAEYYSSPFPFYYRFTDLRLFSTYFLFVFLSEINFIPDNLIRATIILLVRNFFSFLLVLIDLALIFYSQLFVLISSQNIKLFIENDWFLIDLIG